jgi:hypothetical protein
MIVTFDITGDVETRLRERAAAAGKDTSCYAAELVAQAMAIPQYLEPAPEERARMAAAARTLLQKARDMAPTLTGPVITDFDKAFEEIMREKAEKQGLTF